MMASALFRVQLACATLALAGPCYAGTAAVSPATTASAPSLWTTLAALALVVLAIVACGWVMRKFPLGPPRGQALLRVTGQLSLGARERIVLVEYGCQRLVLGVTASQIHLLTTDDLPENTGTPSAVPPDGGFHALWQTAKARMQGSTPPEPRP